MKKVLLLTSMYMDYLRWLGISRPNNIEIIVATDNIISKCNIEKVDAVIISRCLKLNSDYGDRLTLILDIFKKTDVQLVFVETKDLFHQTKNKM